MTRFSWNSGLETGNELIDAQHRQLIALANLLFDAVEAGQEDLILRKSFEVLLLYTDQHFHDEEVLFGELNLQGRDEHRQEHAALGNEVRDLWVEQNLGFVDDMGSKLENWVELRLMPHMMDSDQSFLAKFGE
jgi:hemerythrin